MFARIGDAEARYAPQKVLVICTRRIGDVLLATPMIRSIKQKWPDAAVDVLVFAGTEAVLENNPDLAGVVTVKRRASKRERWVQARALWRKYDIAYALTPSDRAHFYCWLSGRHRVALINQGHRRWLMRLMFHHYEAMPAIGHTVGIGLAGARMLGIEPSYQVVPPSVESPSAPLTTLHPSLAVLQGKPFAVLQIDAMYRYKLWTLGGWMELVAWLRKQGYGVVLSGGPQAAQIPEIGAVVEAVGLDALNLMGQLSLAQLATLIRQAALYVGPDTGVSHIAAATGTPTVAIFGPSSPTRWGPWPASWNQATSPWAMRGSGRIGNVFLVQGSGSCVPCLLEGCERHRQSDSACLTTLGGRSVIAAAATMLGIAPVISFMPGGENSGLRPSKATLVSE